MTLTGLAACCKLMACDNADGVSRHRLGESDHPAVQQWLPHSGRIEHQSTYVCMYMYTYACLCPLQAAFPALPESLSKMLAIFAALCLPLDAADSALEHNILHATFR